jgi:hypothetical protein
MGNIPHCHLHHKGLGAGDPVTLQYLGQGADKGLEFREHIAGHRNFDERPHWEPDFGRID